MRKNTIYAIIGVVLVLSANLYFRSFPINLPQLKDHAGVMIDQRIRQQAINDVSSNFSDFSSYAKDKLLEDRVRDFKQKNARQIAAEINKEYLKLKDRYQDADNQTYLMELDCWHWASYVDNVVRLGHPGYKVVKGRQLDTLMISPDGSFLAWDHFILYTSAFLYKAFSFFKRVPLFTFLFYIPLFYIVLLTLAIYFFARRLGGNIAAFVAAMFVGLCPIFIPRSCAGWFDKDILCLLFPVLILWSYALHSVAETKIKKIAWLCLSSFWVGLFCFTWTSWWFIFIIIILTAAINLSDMFVRSLRDREGYSALFRKELRFTGLFLLMCAIWIAVFCGFEPFRDIFINMKNAFTLNKPMTISIWPNVFSTVGELRRAGYVDLSRAIGGVYVFTFSLLSIVAVLVFNRRYDKFRHLSMVALMLWAASMFFACLKGIRFTMFLSVPLGVFAGWGISELSKFALRKKADKRLVYAIVLILIASLALPLAKGANNSSRNIYPLMDDVWYKLLTVINQNTPQDAVLNSWWDFGDWFKAVAKRRVIFDGQSQNIPQAYWMAKVFLSSDERQALGVLRMLNNGGNKAFDIINRNLEDPFRSILILDKLIELTYEQANNVLMKMLPSEDTKAVLKILFDKPAQAYFIVDPTLISKIHAISYIGNWDFIKVCLAKNIASKSKDEIINYLNSLGVEKPLRAYQEASLISADLMETWISSRLQFFSGIVKGREQDGMVFFQNGFIYNPEKKSFYLFVPQENATKVPLSLFLEREDGSLEEIMYPNANLGFSAMVYRDREGYKAVMFNRELGRSLFVRLYFLQGKGLENFELFAQGVYGDDKIGVYKILW